MLLTAGCISQAELWFFKFSVSIGCTPLGLPGADGWAWFVAVRGCPGSYGLVGDSRLAHQDFRLLRGSGACGRRRRSPWPPDLGPGTGRTRSTQLGCTGQHRGGAGIVTGLDPASAHTFPPATSSTASTAPTSIITGSRVRSK